MKGAWQTGLSEAWYSGAWWLWLLRPLEGLFRMLAALRRRLYKAGVLHSYRAPIPIVVVGNITVGGSGKTPVVIALVEALVDSGIRVGVVSRGYGASAGEFPRIVDDSSLVADCGDEPLLIYRRTGCPCVVDPSRAAAVRTLVERFTPQVVLCDDGLQHYSLRRDLEIVLLDARRSWGNGFCLPAGPLREPVSRLKRADYVLHRGGEDAATAVSYIQDCLVNLVNAEERPVSPRSLGPRVHVLAGIGQPGQFFESLEKLGFNVQTHVFPDHHQYCAADFSGLRGRPIIMTEKDAVKCRDLAGPQAWYVKISAQLPAVVTGAVVDLVRS